MNRRLEPCPFCGSDNVAFTPDEDQQLEDTTTGFIWCHGCGFSSDSFYSEKIAAEHWNRRAAPKTNEALTLGARIRASNETLAEFLASGTPEEPWPQCTICILHKPGMCTEDTDCRRALIASLGRPPEGDTK